MRYFTCVMISALVGAAQAQDAPPPANQPIHGHEALESVRAVIAAERAHMHTGKPIWIDFVLYNTSDQPVTLEMPDVDPAPTENLHMGLPLEHVFSGQKFRALSIIDGRGVESGDEVMFRPPSAVPPVTLGPKAVVGVRVEMSHHYLALRRSGLYLLQWRPYGGQIKSNTLRIEVRPLKDVVITTNMGKLRLRLLYDKAPNHVANFLELVSQGFYTRTTFFRVFTGVASLGGDPNNDGSGMRKDGKTIKAEFNDTPFEEGTVGMSLAGKDPDSASCQFFICMRRIKPWDWKYTAFAKVVGEESLETLRRIGQAKVDDQDRPLRDIIIERTDVETVRQKAVQETLIPGR